MNANANVGREEVRIGGNTYFVPSAKICGQPVIITGRFLRVAAIKDEELVDGETVAEPGVFLNEIRRSFPQADVFSFVQKIPDVIARHSYMTEWDNAAVIPITSLDDWLKNRVSTDVRKSVKKAARLGVVVMPVEFDDELVRGIMGIYNDSPIRQGKAFWHYKKEFEKVKSENATYLERSQFIGAYFQNELIGFIKMVYVDRIATTIQVISKKSQYDKKSTNALLAKAIEICSEKRLSHLVYGSYAYNDTNSSLTEFKRRNGFEKVMFPRYFVPLTSKGLLAVKLGLHRGLWGNVPEPARAFLRRARSGFCNAVFSREKASA